MRAATGRRACGLPPPGGEDDAAYARVLRAGSSTGDDANRQLAAWGDQALVRCCQHLSRTLRKMAYCEYVMGKELLRKASLDIDEQVACPSHTRSATPLGGLTVAATLAASSQEVRAANSAACLAQHGAYASIGR